MNRINASLKTRLTAMVITVVVSLTALAAFGTGKASAEPADLEELAQGQAAVFESDTLPLALAANGGGDSQSRFATTASQLADLLNAGSEEVAATGDDATGIVTVTGMCAGAEGAGLPLIGVVSGPQLQGLVFDGVDASMLFDANGGTLQIYSIDGETPFTLSGEGAVQGIGNSPTIAVGSNSGSPGALQTGVLILGSGVTIESENGQAIRLLDGSCDVREGATVEALARTTIQIGHPGASDVNASYGELTIAGTVRNPNSEALLFGAGEVTIASTGLVECNTSGGMTGVAIGMSDSDVKVEDTGLVTLAGGTIRDLAGENAHAPTVWCTGYGNGVRCTFTMTGGVLEGGSVEAPALYTGYPGSASGTVTISGGAVECPTGSSYALANASGSDVTISGGSTLIDGCIQVAGSSTGLLDIQDGIISADQGVTVLSPDATVRLGAIGTTGPVVSPWEIGGESESILCAEGCTAMVYSGLYMPNVGDGTIDDEVEQVISISRGGEVDYEIVGQTYINELSIDPESPVTVLRATTGTISLPHAMSGVTVSDATGGEGEIAIVTPYGVVTIGPDAPGVVPGLPEDTVTVYRLYNPYMDGAHLLTADESEVADLEELGWESEGKRFTEYANPTTGSVAVYRLYNSANGDHFFTASNAEAASLQSVGWTREGVAWYAPTLTTVPAYRLYNPYQTEYEGLGNHLWTILETERDDLVSLGWQSESVGWYALPLE